MIIWISFITVLAAASPAMSSKLQAPRWASVPSPEIIARAYPRAALRQGLAGAARITCLANGSGALKECRVTGEAPGGYGFGAAALALTHGMKLAPSATPDLDGWRRIDFEIKFGDNSI